jgi:hypothetical protein
MVSLLNAGCRKDIQEPKHKNKGKNVIYLKIDEQEFLIKEGFSLNRNVIRADIGGNGAEPKYNEGEYFGKKTVSLAFNFVPQKGSEEISPAAFDLEYYPDNFSTEGLFNSINVDFFSKKHNSKISIWQKGYGWSSEYSPKIEILKHDPQNEIISGTVRSNYKDFNDTTKTGEIYIYFDLTYNSKK